MAGDKDDKPPDENYFKKPDKKIEKEKDKDSKKSKSNPKTGHNHRSNSRTSVGKNSPFTHINSNPQHSTPNSQPRSSTSNATTNVTTRSTNVSNGTDYLELLKTIQQLDPIKKMAITKALQADSSPASKSNKSRPPPPGFQPLSSSSSEHNNSDNETEMSVSEFSQTQMDTSFVRPKAHIRRENKRKRKHSKSKDVDDNYTDNGENNTASKKKKTLPSPRTKNSNETTNKPSTSKNQLNTKFNTKESTKPLFVEKKESAKREYIFSKVKDLIKGSRYTQNGNLLIYPKSNEAKEILLKIESQEFKVRITKGSQLQKRPNPSPTLAVVRGVSKQLTDAEFKEFSGLEGKRIISAATNEPTTLMRIKCESVNQKEHLIKNGLSISFGKKLTVVDYKPNNPLQCHNCMGFGHRATTCPSEIICKKCANKGHSSKNCTKPDNQEDKCANCEGNHPATFAACPSFQQAKHLEEGNKLKTHQKISKPAEPLQATRLATCISFCIITTLQPYLENIDYKQIIETVRSTVNILYKAQVEPEHMKALLPQLKPLGQNLTEGQNDASNNDQNQNLNTKEV